MFDLVIFDWDGTLADTKQVIVFAFQKVLNQVGCNVSSEDLEKLIGIGAKNMFKSILRAENIPFTENLIQRLVHDKNEIHKELGGMVELFDGSLDLLEALQGNIPIALATMSSRTVIYTLLSAKGIRDYFSYIITADDVEHPKPDPEVFLKCARYLNVKPELSVVIEDSVFGVVAAKKANMNCIAIPSGSYSIEELKKHEPHLIVNSINERQTILNFIFHRIPHRKKIDVNLLCNQGRFLEVAD